ncbi:MAG: hypothetical protein HYR88_03195 [Verrucomicrobia bacterium]|nr:hypothetical protein [Verrucomicrobiota bacterium]MBI3869588.1 hypothetical protein [Verrucomicrobiota bacterium]
MTKRATAAPSAAPGSAVAALSPRLLALLLAGVLALILGFLFRDSFRPGWTHFLNDGPLGALKADYNKTPDAFFGVWQDLNWVGAHGGSLLPSFTFGQFQLLGPVGFSKFHAPIALFFLGLATWVACRGLGFRPAVSFIAAIAASLNMNVLSNACWGLSSRPWALAVSLLAVGAIGSAKTSKLWVRCALAGLAVGMGITEGADVGIIFSVFVGCFGLMFFSFQGRPSAANVGRAVARVAVVAAFAGFMAFHIIDALVFRAKVMDAVTSQKQNMSPEQQWGWATQWSLPKAETFRLIIPGLHGYRMDTPQGGRYWGTAGRDPQWETTQQGFARFSGAGEYAGVTVVLVAAFACFLGWRNPGNVFTPLERSLIGFWAGSALVALLFAWGRYAPFYRLLYELPVFSSFRNPIKWTHPLHLALLLLFAYGLEGLWRGYIEKLGVARGASTGWARLGGFEKRWVWGSVAFFAVSALAWLVYVASGDDLVRHLIANAVADPRESAESVAREVARFSQSEVAIYVFVLGVSVALVALAISGFFAGARSRWAIAAFGIVVAVDLSRANLPWIQEYNYELKYASNPVLDFLRQQPGHARTTVAPFGMRELGPLQRVYQIDWMQQHFPFYNIPSIDVVQDPRPLPENIEFQRALRTGTNIVRLWELTSTRYILGLSGQFAAMMDQQIDGSRGRFRPALNFNFVDSGEREIGVVTNEPTPFSVLEFTGALPRASLITSWETATNGEAILKRIADPAFNPASQVVVSADIPPPKTAAPAPGKAEIVSYSPKRIQVKTHSAADGILMLTDKFDTDWKVSVDGKETPLLRCDFLLRGAQTPAGDHTVDFVFQPSTAGLYISLSAIGVGILLLGILVAGPKSSNAQ